ncbi:hypothetical protein NGG16_03045 [Enterococcus casseliflavus]|uniref:hypothetical protein n=1 Tax=Enterococcus casseliflavus TaxID=37734 RepID=UPI002DBE6866|nr:hypothetical protein [Enterococcus casseliflavus]MEB8416411.1 hypothetical protein [Enterococcus casseliflavus]
MRKNDYYLLVIRRYMQEFLILACIYFSLSIISSGYDWWASYQIYSRGIRFGDLGSLFWILGMYYGLFLVIKGCFTFLKMKDNWYSFIKRQGIKWWAFYLVMGTVGYFGRFYEGEISISDFRSFYLFFLFVFFFVRWNQVCDQSVITHYGLAQKQTHLNYFMYRGSKKEFDAVTVQDDRYIKLNHSVYYYRIKYTPFFLTVSDHYADYFKRCAWNLLFSFMLVYLSINGMIEEKNVLRYIGLLFMSCSLALSEMPTLFEMVEHLKQWFKESRKGGKK